MTSQECRIHNLKTTFFLQLNHILHGLEQKLESMSSNVAIALLPIAVRWASPFLYKSDALYVEKTISLKTNIHSLI
jgi:hypothetical protein